MINNDNYYVDKDHKTMTAISAARMLHWTPEKVYRNISTGVFKKAGGKFKDSLIIYSKEVVEHLNNSKTYPKQPVDVMAYLLKNLSVRGQTCLSLAGITTLEKLLSHTEKDLLRSKHFNKNITHNIKDVLENFDLCLKTETEVPVAEPSKTTVSLKEASDILSIVSLEETLSLLTKYTLVQPKPGYWIQEEVETIRVCELEERSQPTADVTVIKAVKEISPLARVHYLKTLPESALMSWYCVACEEVVFNSNVSDGKHNCGETVASYCSSEFKDLSFSLADKLEELNRLIGNALVCGDDASPGSQERLNVAINKLKFFRTNNGFTGEEQTQSTKSNSPETKETSVSADPVIKPKPQTHVTPDRVWVGVGDGVVAREAQIIKYDFLLELYTRFQGNYFPLRDIIKEMSGDNNKSINEVMNSMVNMLWPDDDSENFDDDKHLAIYIRNIANLLNGRTISGLTMARGPKDKHKATTWVVKKS